MKRTFGWKAWVVRKPVPIWNPSVGLYRKVFVQGPMPMGESFHST